MIVSVRQNVSESSKQHHLTVAGLLKRPPEKQARPHHRGSTLPDPTWLKWMCSAIEVDKKKALFSGSRCCALRCAVHLFDALPRRRCIPQQCKSLVTMSKDCANTALAEETICGKFISVSPDRGQHRERFHLCHRLSVQAVSSVWVGLDLVTMATSMMHMKAMRSCLCLAFWQL